MPGTSAGPFLALVLLGAASTAAAQTGPPDYETAMAASQAAIGRQLPDYAFTRADGRRMRMSDFRGKPLLVQFVYTACSQSCPIAVKQLERAIAEARAVLGNGAFAAISVGFNQPFDTPAAMAAFARNRGIADPDWHFVAPDAETVAAMTRDLGFSWYATPKGFDHLEQVSLVDAQGRVYVQIYGERLDARALVEPLRRLERGTDAGSADWRALMNRVRLFCTVYDANTGRYRLDYSLFVEIFAGLTILGGVAASLLGEWRRQRRHG